MSIIFRQLFDEQSSTLTYLLADAQSGDAVLIDTVAEHSAMYLGLLRELDLNLVYLLETHAHADHVTGAGVLREHTTARTATGHRTGVACADLQLTDGDTLVFGDEVMRVIATPGHTPGCVTYRWRNCLFTGDALLIGGCGRTDFQGGDAGALYDSITQRLFTLPDETLVYPAHDYKGMRVSSIGQEKLTNSRLPGRSRQEFIELMQSLDLPRPRLIEQAVPANLRCGLSAGPLDIHAS
ncbi:MAG: sulfur dioxygenase [Thauera sp.]|jgi:glyoxylase-like metal-dependent hydrolase (beta-lactamase superfamily II)|uniref:MBL fold metallo-hydrolase n=1 Tax=Thauera sp. TaxID=1905334 RepID=UPI0024AA8E53|nr:MBL fold metallo-hydrolase [Thauera sp.]MDI3488732.1 sulfur dioxygenase [Thauera sp.]